MQIWENIEGASREYFEVREFKSDENCLLLKIKSDKTGLVGKQVLLNFEVAGHEFFSVGDFKGPENDLYQLNLCPKIFRFEKRKYMRIPNDFAKRMSLKITNGNAVEYFKLDNVSPEGAAMILSTEKQKMFAPKNNFKNIILELNDLIFKIAIVVVQHSTLLEDSPDLIKIGMRFKEIDSKEKRGLVKEVQNCLYQNLKK
jgi:hypothetical protein